MIDATCLVCTPRNCIHGEQSVEPELVRLSTVEEQLAAVTAERDELKKTLEQLQRDIRRAWGTSRGEYRTNVRRAP